MTHSRKMTEQKNNYTIVPVEDDSLGNCYRVVDGAGNYLSPHIWSFVAEPQMDPWDSGRLKPLLVYHNDSNSCSLVSEDMQWLPKGVPEFAMVHRCDYYEIFHDGYYYLTADGKILTPDGPIRWDEPLPGGWAWNEVRPFDSWDETVTVLLMGEWVYMNTEGTFSHSDDFTDSQ